MAYLNKAQIIGRLGKDPEIKVTGSGKKKASFSVATSKKWKDQSGEQKEVTNWHNIIAWGKTADLIEMLQVQKGTEIYLEGEISYRSWDGPDGQKKYITEIELASFQILSAKNQSQGAPTGQKPQATAPQTDGYGNSADDDLPF